MFYEYRQNNTGGSFVVEHERGISHFVIIEAHDANHANERAEAAGLYFNGCNDGLDCDCCGDRWYSAYGAGDEEPAHYGEAVPEKFEDYDSEFKFRSEDGPQGYIHYLDGTIKPVLV